MKETLIRSIEQYTAIRTKAKGHYDGLGYIKLALFVLLVALVYGLITQWTHKLYQVGTVTLLVLQIVLWIAQARLRTQIAHATGRIEICRRHMARLTGDWVSFPDTGDAFVDPSHLYGLDLDIVGPKSLFQFVNTTHTWHGRKAFAKDLLHAAYPKKEILQRQKAIQELAQNRDFCDELEYRFSCVGHDPATPKLLSALQDQTPFMGNRILRMLITFLPAVSILLAVVAGVFQLKGLYMPVLVLFFLQAVLWLIGFLPTGRYLSGISSLPIRLGKYEAVLELMEKTHFQSEMLQEIQQSLSASQMSAARGIKAISKITERVSVRSNGLFYFLLNILLLWDYECAFLLQDWKKTYAPHCENWFLALGDLESLCSFGVFANVCSPTCYPTMGTERGIEADALGHPLLPNEERVTNPLSLKDNILIISGSNMSGKTTYLRTVGINMVLAKAGSCVCADRMHFSDLRIATSMRIADNLNEGISTFYAELKRIKEILDAARADNQLLFLIDEIFRGTNSVDRLSGAQTVLKKLRELDTLGMITTHDLELCNLADTVPGIQNYSFSETYQEGKILFDYTLQEGRSQTTNAKYLMEIIGILS